MARSNFYLTGFGTFTLPITIEKLVDLQASPFKEFHSGCKGSIGRKSYCKECNQEITTDDIVKGIPTEGKPIVFTKDEIKSLHPENITEAAIEITALIPTPNYRYLNGNHHAIVPQKKMYEATKQGLELFLHMLKVVKRVALVRYYDCNKVYNAIITCDGIMSGIYYSAEIKELPITYDRVKDKDLISHLTTFAEKHVNKFKVDITKDVVNTYFDNLQKKALEKQKEGTFKTPKIKKVKTTTKKEDVISTLEESLKLLNEL